MKNNFESLIELSYATEICLTNGVPIESLSKTMGHKNISTTQRYAKVTNEKVSKDMGNLSNALQNYVYCYH
jgi:site-specific recombinase XerD